MRSDGTIKVTFLVTVAESCPVTILLLLFLIRRGEEEIDCDQ